MSGHSEGMSADPIHVPLAMNETEVVLQRWRTELSLTVRDVSHAAVARLLRDEVMRMETSVSRFRPDSELSIVNRQTGDWTTVSWYFVEVLTAALDVAELSDGIVDPCLAHLVDAAGYQSWRGGDPIPEADERVLGAGHSWRDVEIVPAGSHARVRVPPGLSLDLGAVAKGWLADRVAERAVADFGSDAVANMGGDLRAIAHAEPWTITADPSHPDCGETDLVVWDAGLATSGVGRRTWTNRDGKRAHHIIDPRTGLSADTPWWSCSVLANGAAAANAASTAGIILAADGPSWVGRQGLDAWFVGDAGECRVGRWPVA